MLNNLFSKKNKNTENETEESTDSISNWIEEKNENGKMAIDVYQTPQAIIIKAILAGIQPENLKISLHNDLLTIKGFYQNQETISEDDYLYKECYFGDFSRSIILPHEVDDKKIEASLEEGVLTVILPKIDKNNTNITIKS
jgi:HSP20 family protein